MTSARRRGIGRRAFFFSCVAALVIWIRRHTDTNPEAADVARIVTRRLEHLELHPDDVIRFAEAYAESNRQNMRLYHRLTGWHVVDADWVRGWLSPAHRDALVGIEREVVAAFLQSSTYLREPEVMPVRFSRLVDPYREPCRNQFARFDFD